MHAETSSGDDPLAKVKGLTSEMIVRREGVCGRYTCLFRKSKSSVLQVGAEPRENRVSHTARSAHSRRDQLGVACWR